MASDKQTRAWWRHQMETFSALLAICAGNSPVPGEFPAQRPVTQSFDVFFYLRWNKRLGKQSWGWWFETLSHPLWRHRNVLVKYGFSWQLFFCVPWQPVHSNSAISLATMKWGKSAHFKALKFIFMWIKHGKKSIRERAVIGFDHGLPCRVKNMALGPQ